MADLEAAQGCWNIISVEVEGREFPPGSARIVITGDRFVSIGMGMESEGILRIDESAALKTFDLTYDKGPHAGKVSLGIYELKGDGWKMCLGMAGVRRRPERFATAPGSGHALQTLRRGVAPPAVALATAAGGGAPTELEGEWRMLSCIQNGKALAKAYVQYTRRVFAGDSATLYIGDQISAQSRFRLNPPEIDYIDLDQAGIYELDGNKLKIAVAERGGKRPGDFSAAAGDRRTVTEWKRR
jgi:uncharacterized protein (TIGR03067 family)